MLTRVGKGGWLILGKLRLASLPFKVTASNWHHLRVGDYRCFDRTGHYIGLSALEVVSACTYDIRSH